MSNKKDQNDNSFEMFSFDIARKPGEELGFSVAPIAHNELPRHIFPAYDPPGLYAVVHEVYKDSTADRIGLKEGDLLLREADGMYKLIEFEAAKKVLTKVMVAQIFVLRDNLRSNKQSIEPIDKDVLFCKANGGLVNHDHKGNFAFRTLLTNYRREFKQSQQLVDRVVDIVYKKGGRFLEQAQNGVWYELDRQTAAAQTAKYLCEEVMASKEQNGEEEDVDWEGAFRRLYTQEEYETTTSIGLQNYKNFLLARTTAISKKMARKIDFAYHEYMNTAFRRYGDMADLTEEECRNFTAELYNYVQNEIALCDEATDPHRMDKLRRLSSVLVFVIHGRNPKDNQEGTPATESNSSAFKDHASKTETSGLPDKGNISSMAKPIDSTRSEETHRAATLAEEPNMPSGPAAAAAAEQPKEASLDPSNLVAGKATAAEMETAFALFDFQKANVVVPTEKDILLGRGRRANKNPGNVHFRQIIAKHRHAYLNFTIGVRKGKTEMAEQIVNELHSQGVRFLRKEMGQWMVVPVVEARRKTSQALREGLNVREGVFRAERMYADERAKYQEAGKRTSSSPQQEGRVANAVATPVSDTEEHMVKKRKADDLGSDTDESLDEGKSSKRERKELNASVQESPSKKPRTDDTENSVDSSETPEDPTTKYDRLFRKMKAYKEAKGSCHLAPDHPDTELVAWAQIQHEAHKNKTMPLVIEIALGSIGFFDQTT